MITRLTVCVYDGPDGRFIANWSARVQSPRMDTNSHGASVFDATIQLGRADVIWWCSNPKAYHLEICDHTQVVWEGRIEDVSPTTGGIRVTAYGYWRALYDLPYTGLWSTQKTDQFAPIPNRLMSSRMPERYEVSNDNGVYMAPRKGERVVTNSTDNSMNFKIPDGSTNLIYGVSFDYVTKVMKTGWTFRCVAHNGLDSGATVVASWTPSTTPGTQVVQSASAFFAFDGKREIYFDMYWAGTSEDQVYDTGLTCFEIRNIRIATAGSDGISTTLTANASAGSNVTLSVASTARMFVGQRILIGTSTQFMEPSVITSVNSSTSITVATLPQNRTSGMLVRAIKMETKTIASGLLSSAPALHSSTAFVQSSGVDHAEEVYEDEYPADILNALTALGDFQGREWVASVRDRCLVVAPKGSTGRTWLVDIDERAFELSQSLEELANSVYGVYEDPDTGETKRTATTTDTLSVQRFGITRRRAVKVDTTALKEAQTARDAELADAATMPSRARLSVRRVRTPNGGQAGIHEIMAGDTIIINALPLYNTALDSLQSFVVDETSYAGGSTIEITPAAPPPRLQAQEARRRRYG